MRRTAALIIAALVAAAVPGATGQATERTVLSGCECAARLRSPVVRSDTLSRRAGFERQVWISHTSLFRCQRT